MINTGEVPMNVFDPVTQILNKKYQIKNSPNIKHKILLNTKLLDAGY